MSDESVAFISNESVWTLKHTRKQLSSGWETHLNFMINNAKTSEVFKLKKLANPYL